MALSIEQITRLVFRQLAPTVRRVNLMISRAVVRRVDDGGLMQRVQLSLLGDSDGDDVEVADDVEHLQPFGVSFVPPAGSEVAALCVGGNRDHILALCASSRAHRPTGAQAGEGGLYTLTGWKVFCDADGHVYIGADEAGGATHPLALADRVDQRFQDIVNVIMNTNPTATNDGGASLIEAMRLALTLLGWSSAGAPPQTTGSSKLKGVE